MDWDYSGRSFFIFWCKTDTFSVALLRTNDEKLVDSQIMLLFTWCVYDKEIASARRPHGHAAFGCLAMVVHAINAVINTQRQ